MLSSKSLDASLKPPILLNSWGGSAREIRKGALLARLSSHHRLLYDLVRQRGEVNPGELWEAYLAESSRLARPAIALRTFSEYMNRLIELELVQWDRALVRGKVRVFTMLG